jgi:alkanesulfonate monooxygenase
MKPSRRGRPVDELGSAAHLRRQGSRVSLHFHWFLPTYGDSRNLMAGGHGSSMAGDRPATLKYLNQIGAAAEASGFESVLTPTGAWCEDAWLTTAMMVETTETLKFLVALRPGLLSPTLAAQMASTFQWQSQGRLLLNVVTGGEDHEQRTYGDYLDKNQRYARCGEFLDVIRRLWSGNGPVDYAGEYIRVENASLQRIPDPVPPIFFGGSSPAAGTVASQFADTYLTWGEPPSAVAGKIAWIRDLAEVQGRTLDYGIRLHVISRDTSEEAWAEADRLLAALDPATVEQAQQSLARSGSEGQRRMRELHGGGSAYSQAGDARSLEVAPNLWAGVGLVRGGAGTALVGSHEEVADRIAEYAALGLDHFVLSGYPHLEESYRFGEGVRPILERRGLVQPLSHRPGDLSGSTAFLSSRR